MSSGRRILEHTADVGVEAWGRSLSEVFKEAAVGMAEIAGVWSPGDGGERHEIALESGDTESLLVDWLSELLWLHDAQRVAFAGFEVEVDPPRLRATVRTVPLGEEPPEGTQVKAVTYHQLMVERTPDGYRARVFLDI